MYHHTRVLINLRAYERNLREIASRLSPGSRLCAVLKADAYGHGLELLAPVADSMNVGYIGVVDNWEIELIRNLSIQRPVIRLRPALADEVEEALPFHAEETVGSFEQAKSISRLGEKNNLRIPVHLALDVGIGRMGFTYSLQSSQIARLCDFPGIRICGVMTHFPNADEEDLSITQTQWARFQQDCQDLKKVLPGGVIIHAANSAAIARFPEMHAQLVRLGILSYGLTPSDWIPLPDHMEPVMSVVTTAVQVRDMPRGATAGYGMTWRLDRDSRIATLPIGYANGYLRDFSNNAQVLIRGERCPVVGRISMNLVTVDVSRVSGVCPGDEVVLLGTQGDEAIRAEELARKAGTINYEITCLLGNENRADRIAV